MRQIPTSLRFRLISIKFNSQTGMNRELQWPDPKVLSYWNLFKHCFRYFVWIFISLKDLGEKGIEHHVFNDKMVPFNKTNNRHTQTKIFVEWSSLGGGGGKEGLFVSRLNLPDPPIELFDNLVMSPHRQLTGSYFSIFPPFLYSATATTELLSVSPRRPSEPPKKSPSPPHPRAKKTTGLLAKVFLNGKKLEKTFN